MRERLCSSWTVTLPVQTAHTLAAALHRLGRDGLAIKLDALAARTRQDFQRLLIPGGTLAGFAHFHAHKRIEYLLQPSDRTTGIHYRLLPMIHALINGMLTPEQARTHVELIRTQLLAPDGRGSSTARRISRRRARVPRAREARTSAARSGSCHVHAHLRYAEAMATVEARRTPSTWPSVR
jgi:cellobiose phosphorylase